VAKAKEHEKYRSKMDERKILNSINSSDAVKFKIKKGSISTYDRKAFILIQAGLSCIIFCYINSTIVHTIDNWKLKMEQNEIMNTSWRILNCIREYYIHTQNTEGVINSILLKKSVKQKLWDDSPFIFKQFKGIGEKIAKNIYIVKLIDVFNKFRLGFILLKFWNKKMLAKLNQFVIKILHLEMNLYDASKASQNSICHTKLLKGMYFMI
jgi:hypothetical protein